MIDVAVIIVSWNVREYLANCLRSICKDLGRSQLHGEIFVVDNASTDGTVSLLRDLFPQVHVISNDTNVGFGAANNQGMKAAAAYNPKYYFLLNPDTYVRAGALEALISCLEERPHAGMAGARLIYGDGGFQHSAFYFPGLGQLMFDLLPMPARLYQSRFNGRYPRRLYRPRRSPFKIDHPLGATMMVRADVAESTHGFDESFHMYCEEIDWSWRVRQAGWEIYAVPAAEIIHYAGESTSQVPADSIVNLWRSREQLYRKHHGRLHNAVAARLVRRAMARKARKASDPELQRAYQEVVSIWSKNGHQ
ncbi:MAG: glycosyltransferase family 2 protein [Candidatus Promineifilaceae bacterium]|nr:glycosyltransferase family 2 protein [Candidatus Promineifilaceae bacterium]